MASQTAFWIIATVTSFLYGVFAIRIFVNRGFRNRTLETKTENGIQKTTVTEQESETQNITQNLPWLVHQFWLNFLGSAVGWIALNAIKDDVIASMCQTSKLGTISVSDVLLFFAAFVGITGHMPAAIVGAVAGIKEIASKLLSFGK